MKSNIIIFVYIYDIHAAMLKAALSFVFSSCSEHIVIVSVLCHIKNNLCDIQGLVLYI